MTFNINRSKQAVNRSSQTKTAEVTKAASKQLFKKRSVESVPNDNWILKPKDNAFEKPNKPTDSSRNIKVADTQKFIQSQQANKPAKLTKNAVKKPNEPIDGFKNLTSQKIQDFIKARQASIDNQPTEAAEAPESLKYLEASEAPHQPAKAPKIATKAKDIIPEYLGKVVNFKKAKKFFNPNIGKNKLGKNKQENIAQGNFGVVQHAYAKRKNKNKNMSRLFVKKKMKIKDPKQMLVEDKQNKMAGIASKIDATGQALVTEYDGETLKNLFKAEHNNTQNIKNPYISKKMSVETKIDLSRQLLTEVSKLNKKGIIHADIKPDNLLINNKGKLSVIDFGVAIDASSSPDPENAVVKLGAHPANIIPPEVSQSFFVNNRFDSWSAGLVIYQLFTGRDILEGVRNPSIWDQQKYYTVYQNVYNNVTNNPNIPQEAKILMYNLLDPNPATRASAKNALKLDLFTKYGRPSLVALSTQHDKNFKELARLESELEKTSVIKLKKQQELKAKIQHIKAEMKKLQAEINKFNTE